VPNENVSCASSGNNTPPASANKDKKPVKVRASLFFDGTCNNRTNTEARNPKSLNHQAYLDEGNHEDDSFENDETNVARLERMQLKDKKNNPDYDVTFTIYTEGIGTTDLKGDSNMKGAAFGLGDTGVEAKVEKGVKALYRNIVNVNAPDKLIELITIDTCGFSRGAAAARNAIHVILEDEKLKLKQQLEGAGYTVQKIEIRFVGLFDTVSHHGMSMDDDVEDLHLNAITNAQQVVQLAAADEYRHNFPLINIRSNGTEIQLPGVHSDVGGSYNAMIDEKDLKVLSVSAAYSRQQIRSRFDREKVWLIDEGWFKDIKEEIDDRGSHVVLNRYNILNTYTYIPMSIMKNHAGKSLLKFNELRMESYMKQVDSSADLRALRALLGPLGSEAWRGQRDLMRRIRHKYCHFNALYSFVGVNDPDWSTGNAMTGVRKRTVYDG